MTDIPRWPKISLLDDPDEEERARQKLNESRRQRGLPPLYPESGLPPQPSIFGIIPGIDKLPDPREIDLGFYKEPGDFNFVEGEPGVSRTGIQVAQAQPPSSPPPAAGQGPEGAISDDGAQGLAQGKPAPSGRPLTYEQIKELVRENNRSKLPDEMIIAIIFKESSFNPSAHNKTEDSDEAGLMQMTKGAWGDAHARFPKGTKYDFRESAFNPAINIQLGSTYLQQRIDWVRGNMEKGIAGYGTGTPEYAQDIIAATNALQQNPKDPVAVLSHIYRRKYR